MTEVQVRDLRDYIKQLQMPAECGGMEMNVDKEFHVSFIWQKQSLQMFFKIGVIKISHVLESLFNEDTGLLILIKKKF